MSWKFCDISSKMICTNSFMICRFTFYTYFHRRAEFNLFIFLDKKNVVFFKVGQLHVNVKEGGRFTKITIADNTRSRTACHSEQNLFEKWHFLLFVSLIQGYKIKKGIESLLIFQRKCLKIFPTYWTDFVHSELVL